MNPETAPRHDKAPMQGEGMLFVRTGGILQTMIKAPLFLAGLLLVAVIMPAQNSLGLNRGLDLIIYPDGSTHVTSEFETNSQQPDLEVDLHGSIIDNFVALGENGFLLESQISGETATIETLGTQSVLVEYDIHDLVSKEGRVWSFVIDAPSNYALLMPENTVIVGMSDLPLSMEISGEQARLLLPRGPVQIDYIFAAPPVSPAPVRGDPEIGGLVPAVIVITAAALAAAIIYYKRARRQSAEPVQPVPVTAALDPAAIFRLRPDLREDDKELVSFIYQNGGAAKESELRKKFLQPRTTMWRAVKRLQRYGVVEIEKKDQQNLVRLSSSLEEQ